jgi:hypothetical protein
MKTNIDWIVQYACEWWLGKRPTRFSVKDHLLNPTINTVSDRERNLAESVAEYLKDKKI